MPKATAFNIAPKAMSSVDSDCCSKPAREMTIKERIARDISWDIERLERNRKALQALNDNPELEETLKLFGVYP